VLSARRVDQQSAHASVPVGLKRDPNRELGNEKVPSALRTEAEFRKSPASGQLDGQELAVSNDVEYSLTLCFIPTRVSIKDRRMKVDLSVLRTERAAQGI
jgi:hypothetical protein